jgi:hypothetical protein
MQKADEEERRIKVQARLTHAEALSAATRDANIRKELESRLQSMDNELSQQVTALNIARRMHKTAEDAAVSALNYCGRSDAVLTGRAHLLQNPFGKHPIIHIYQAVQKKEKNPVIFAQIHI